MQAFSNLEIMPKLSITSLFLVTTYFAICALNYAIANATIGWLIVGATAILIAVTMIRSFQTLDTFRLGFSVVAGLCLSLTLGFAVETSTSLKLYNLRSPVWKLMSFGRESRKIDDYTMLKKSTFHDLYHTTGMVRLPADPGIPNYENTMRLATCWLALVAGLIGGALFSIIMKPNRQIPGQETGGSDDNVLS